MRKRDAARDKKWVRIAKNDDSEYFLDTTSIRTLPNKSKAAWIRLEVIDLNAYIKRVGLVGSKYHDLSHELVLREFNCGAHEMGFRTNTSYTTSGNVIETFNAKEIEMTPIVPDSIGAAMLEKVCKGK